MSEQTTSTVIPFKSVNLSLIGKRIDKILAKTRQHYETIPTGEEFELFVRDLYSCFPLTIRYDIFFASVMSHIGTRLTRSVIRSIAWRLAGNVPTLRRAIPVPPWSIQRTLEWVPILILRGVPGHNHKGAFGYYYEYRVLAGSAAGLKFTIFWKLTSIKAIAFHMGFRRTRRIRFRFRNGLELVRMHTYILFDPKLTRNDQPGAFKIHVPASLRKVNQQVLRQRYHLDGKCIRGFTSYNDKPCYVCYKGTEGTPGEPGCPVACRPMQLVLKSCPRCQQESTFDPASPSIVCMSCEGTATGG